MDLARMKEGGLDAEFFAIYVAAKYAKDGGSARRALDMIDSVRRIVERYPDKIQLATTAADVRHLKKEGRIAALMGIEGGHAIENSVRAGVRSRLGCRYITRPTAHTTLCGLVGRPRAGAPRRCVARSWQNERIGISWTFTRLRPRRSTT